MIELKNVSKFYYSKGVIASGFTKVSLKFQIGEFVAITGESGSGKSTLLNVISGLDTYQEGEMFINGEETSHYIEKDWEEYRRKYIGNIYQNFNLINSYSVYKNIELVLTLNGVPKKERKKKVMELLEQVKMVKYKNTKVSKLSGGQKQRVAIARALAKDIPIIIADEPTGNLDKASAENVIELLREVSKNKLVIIVTHNYEQIEKYVTRKITMHDGKVLEDKKVKDIEKQEEVQETVLQNIKFWDQFKLGFYNTFNVLPKFILLLVVYSFIVIALMSETSFFRVGEYEASKIGMNYIFQDTNDHRIIINKKDKSAFTEEEIKTLREMENVDYVLKNDILADETMSFASKDEELWISGLINSVDQINKKIDVGRMPTADNEIVIKGPEYDYTLNQNKDKVLNQSFKRFKMAGEYDLEKEYIVVGIIYDNDDPNLNSTNKIYVSNATIDELIYETIQKASTITIDFMYTYHTSNPYTNEFHLETNNWVPRGQIYIPEDYNIYCEKENCRGKGVAVKIKNIYFEKEQWFGITGLYNQKNMNQLLNLPNYKKEEFEQYYYGRLYINPEDYKELWGTSTYQMSVYVKDIEKIDDTAKALEELSYNPLQVRKTLATLGAQELLKILKLFVMIVLIVALFFISYFIIKIILKSRNIYYSILRMLGGSRKTSKNLLIIELLTIANLSYFLFVGIVFGNESLKKPIEFFQSIHQYFHVNDYIILYIVIIGMSFLISIRYARKLFKTSAMEAYREEI